jgi:GNAT superfamily N-acetyltransferase
MVIERCPPERLGELEALLQEGFPSLRGRPLSERFPHAGPPLVALGAGGAILGTTATRAFRWQAGGEDWRGLMIGLVFTLPEARGGGIAGRLLEAAVAVEGLDFAVLWAARRDLYERHGWAAGDTGAVAEVRGRGGDGGGVPLDEALAARLAALRGTGGVQRAACDWLAVPPPALAVEAHVAGGAYALAGRRDGHGYVYELAGDPAGFGAVWDSLLGAYAQLLVNDSAGSPSGAWLERERGVRFAPRPLALWRALSPRAGDVARRGWYVPWLDRL